MISRAAQTSFRFPDVPDTYASMFRPAPTHYLSYRVEADESDVVKSYADAVGVTAPGNVATFAYLSHDGP